MPVSRMALSRSCRREWHEAFNANSCYCFVQGLHALVYDMGTAQETWEWVNLKEVNLTLNLRVYKS